MEIIDNNITEHPDNLELPTNAPNMGEIGITHAYVMGQNWYWDGDGRANAMNDSPLFSPAQIAAFKRGFVDARKEDKGR